MSDKLKITIVNYGVGNIYNLIKAFSKCGIVPNVTEDENDVKNSDAIILPGVGTFEAGMNGLKIRNLTNSIKNFAKSGKPVLGICLGAQLFFDKGYEFGKHQGLGLISGEVISLSKEKVKLPHIGWNAVKKPAGKNWSKSIFTSLPNNFETYFVHSFVFQTQTKNPVLAHTKYGEVEFVSAIKKDNVYGLQFHPELSSTVGLSIIKNFIDLSRATKKLVLQ